MEDQQEPKPQKLDLNSLDMDQLQKNYEEFLAIGKLPREQWNEAIHKLLEKASILRFPSAPFRRTPSTQKRRRAASPGSRTSTYSPGCTSVVDRLPVQQDQAASDQAQSWPAPGKSRSLRIYRVRRADLEDRRIGPENAKPVRCRRTSRSSICSLAAYRHTVG